MSEQRNLEIDTEGKSRVRAIGEIAIDTRMLYDRLQRLKAEETVTYTDLTRIIGRDVQTTARYNLYSAIKMLERENIVLQPVRAVGVKRLSPSSVIGSTEVFHKRIRGASRRIQRRLATVDYNTLDNADKIKHNMSLSLAGAVGMLTSTKNVRQLEKAVSEAHQAIPHAEVLKLFSK